MNAIRGEFEGAGKIVSVVVGLSLLLAGCAASEQGPSGVSPGQMSDSVRPADGDELPSMPPRDSDPAAGDTNPDVIPGPERDSPFPEPPLPLPFPEPGLTPTPDTPTTTTAEIIEPAEMSDLPDAGIDQPVP